MMPDRSMPFWNRLSNWSNDSESLISTRMRRIHHLDGKSASWTHTNNRPNCVGFGPVYVIAQSKGNAQLSTNGTVQGLAVTPGTPRSLHLTEIDLPVPGPSEVQVRVLNAGICGTDREIIDAKLGAPPPDSPDLVIGHEVLGQVEATGHAVSGLSTGDLVTATVRRGCGCPQCAAGASDFCATRRFTERGIFGRHGYMTPRFVEASEHLITVPASLRHIGVLIEPASVAEKAWRVAVAVQSRIAAWAPTTAIVYGAGPIGLLQTLILRARGIEVYTIARRPASESPAAAIVTACGATYLSTRDRDAQTLKAELPNIDLIFECSGSSGPIVDSFTLLGMNGVLVLLSLTFGSHKAEIPVDWLNLEFVSGNKCMVGSVNSTAADFRAAVDDFQTIGARWPGLASRLITHRLGSLDEAVGLMESTKTAIKAIVDLS
jgi:threonine dehydrogenase-like Zn-dependent dehydrogenase